MLTNTVQKPLKMVSLMSPPKKGNTASYKDKPVALTQAFYG